MERSEIRRVLRRLMADIAEFILGPAFGRTRGLHPPYG